MLEYLPETGEFFWKVSRGSRSAGSNAGTLNNGYLFVKVDGVRYPLHRLVFLYVNGEFPEKGFDVDHINRNKEDNRLDNLRIVTRRQNSLNTGVNSNNGLGVSNIRVLKDTGKYQVRVCGKSYGCYSDIKVAESVYQGVSESLGMSPKTIRYVSHWSRDDNGEPWLVYQFYPDGIYDGFKRTYAEARAHYPYAEYIWERIVD